jgi:peroxiredoxin
MVESTEGPVELSERWRQGPLVVAFMRHFGCPFCREQLIDLDRAHDDIRGAGGEVVCVFQYRAAPTRNFCRQRGVDLDCLGDPERQAYGAVGLERGSARDLYSPRLSIALVRAARKGAFSGKPEGDARQMPGTFVVGRDGRLALAHYNRDQGQNPKTEDILEAVRSAA